MSKVRLAKVSIRNILGIEEIEFEPGRLTVISGPNNKGKTAILEAMRSVFNGGQDVSLLRRGAESGEVVLLLDDGTELTEKVNAAGRRTLNVRHPNFGASKQPQTAAERLVNRLTLNPIEFLVSNPARQREMLLQAIPMNVTIEQLQEATGIEGITEADIRGKHALEVISEQHKRFYDQRTGANRSLKEKQVTAAKLRETLPEDPPEGNWTTQYEEVSAELDALDKETALRVDAVQKETNAKHQQLSEQHLGAMTQTERLAMAKIEAIRTELRADLQSLKDEYDNARNSIQDEHDTEITGINNEQYDRRQGLVERRQEAKTMADQVVRSESAKSLLHEMTDSAVGLKAESDMLTAALDGLESLKVDLTATLPIRGLELIDNELYLDGIKFTRWNTARRVTTAIELAKLSAGDLAVVIVDGLENLDSDTFESFSEHVANDTECQYLVTRVTNGDSLRIDTK